MEFKRSIYQELIENSESSKIILLFGPRQVGKTFLLKKLHKKYKNSKYYNLEFPEHSRIFNVSDEEVFNLLKDSATYIFIDEFYYVENMSHIFKALYDLADLHPEQKVKIFASGSSAIEIHKHLLESMAGRYKKFRIAPLSYIEFSSLKHKYNLKDYLIYGGLPEVYNDQEHPNEKSKQTYLKQILSSYIQKDIKSYINEESISAFNNLIYLLAQEQGQVASVSNLARECRLSESTISKYLDLLEQTFVLYKLNSYAKNLSNELKKSKKYYFYDLGIRNAILSRFVLGKDDNEKGKVWEAFCYHELLNFRNEANTEILFWRTSSKLEIDFIWLKDQIPYPIEVKSKLTKTNIPKAFKTFFKAYQNAPFGIIMNENLDEVVDFYGKTIYFISFENIDELENLLG